MGVLCAHQRHAQASSKRLSSRQQGNDGIRNRHLISKLTLELARPEMLLQYQLLWSSKCEGIVMGRGEEGCLGLLTNHAAPC
eukprot:5355781-Pleurochrysis_carterae.AAC.1